MSWHVLATCWINPWANGLAHKKPNPPWIIIFPTQPISWQVGSGLGRVYGSGLTSLPTTTFSYVFFFFFFFLGLGGCLVGRREDAIATKGVLLELRKLPSFTQPQEGAHSRTNRQQCSFQEYSPALGRNARVFHESEKVNDEIWEAWIEAIRVLTEHASKTRRFHSTWYGG
jgi:hypothetical protein